MILDRFDRWELKYVINDAQRRAVIAAMDGRALPDAHGDPGGCYPVASLYYDNDARELFWERERGMPSRRKLRLRCYGGAQTDEPRACFVEIKHNLNGRVAKRRAPLSLADALATSRGETLEAAVQPADALVLDEARRMAVARHLEPVLLLHYARCAYRGDEQSPDLRVTFDSAITARRHRLEEPDVITDDEVSLLDDGMHVLEVKVSSAAPRWLAQAIGEAGCLLQRHSKYARGMSALDPALPTQPAPYWRSPQGMRVSASGPERSPFAGTNATGFQPHTANGQVSTSAAHERKARPWTS